MTPAETTSTGGAATARGMWFQALWVVLQGAADRIRRAGTGSAPGGGGGGGGGGADGVLRLVLEPAGGDVRIEQENGRRIVQLKVKSHGTWSLKDFMTEVLPDLYRAVDLAHENAFYEFVTEGTMGQWRPALTFFNGLGGRLRGKSFDEAYAGLSAVKEVPFRPASSDFWQPHDHTEKGLFDRVVALTRGPEPGRGKQDRREPLDVVRRKVWHLLARLRFSGGHSPERVRREVEHALLAVVPHREDLSKLCDAMAGWVSKHSGVNETAITPAELFAAHGLDRALPVGDLLLVRRRCREAVGARLDALGYQPAWDVRRSPDARGDGGTTTFTALTGGSGEGKSWRVYAAADAAETPAVVLLESSGDAEDDLRRAAGAVWQGALGHDAPKPLANVADHLRDVLGAARGDPWLTVCLDRVADVKVANALLLQPLEDWGVRVVAGCEPHVAARFEQQAKRDATRIVVRRVGPFRPTELHRYLRTRLGDGYAGVPDDVRDLLRNPQLAGIYCDLVTSPDGRAAPAAGEDVWRPRDEYELVDHFWDRLDGPDAAPGARDGLRLRSLAGDVLDGGRYPWSIDQLDAAQLDEAAVGRLVRLGWMRPAAAGRDTYEVPHDRLLGYAAAQALIGRCRAQDLSAQVVTDALAGAQAGPHGRRLGYLLMDWFHLALRDGGDERDGALAQEVLRLYGERRDHRHREDLHRHLLPTIGRRAVPLLLERLRAVAQAESAYEGDPIVAGLADALDDAGPQATHDAVLGLLHDGRPGVRLAGLRLMALRPVPAALDRAWRLHRDMQQDPTPYVGTTYGGKEAARHWLYSDSFDALRAATRALPQWLDRAIRDADRAEEPVSDLAYLVANLADDDDDGATIWRDRKADLFAKVAADKRRSLATNIGRWRDAEEVGRLEEWARSDRDGGDTDLLASAALRAMTRIDVARSVRLVGEVSPETLYLSRGWFLPRLFLLAGDATRDALFARIAAAANPVGAALVYADDANEMDARTLDLLLDALDRRLADGLAAGEADRRSSVSLMEFNLLASVGRADLLDLFARRAGTPLEGRLADYLIGVLGPKCGMGETHPERDPALTVLLRVSGQAFCRVLGAYLADVDISARTHAVRWAKWHADEALLAGIADAASADYPPDVNADFLHFLRAEATRVLAGHASFRGLLRVTQRLGVQLPYDAPEWLPTDFIVDPNVVEAAMAGIRTGSGRVAYGSLILLGLARCDAVMAEAVRMLQSDKDKTARIAALVAIGLSGSRSKQAVEAVASHLRDNELRFAAVQALGRLGGPEADATLATTLTYAWDDRLAVYLAHRAAHRDEVGRALAERISRAAPMAGQSNPLERGTIGVVLAAADDELLADVLRRCDPAVHDLLHDDSLRTEGSLWIAGSKRGAIRGLSFVDPEAARVAAAAALDNPEARDRVLYPPLLYRLDGPAALEQFLRLARDEADDAVLWAMAHALDPAADAAYLRERLAAPDARARAAACRLAAGPCGDAPGVAGVLRTLVDGPSPDVAGEAVTALQHVRAQRQAAALVAALSPDVPPARAAAMVEAALAVGHVGFEHGGFPQWVKDLWNVAPLRRRPALGQAAWDQISRQRKRAADRAESDAKSARRRK